MCRFFLTCAWAAALFAPPAANSQTFSIREINPTRSNIGGNNATGGRVNHLGRATDTVIYAASEFGGLFKSTDAGRTWTRLDSHLPTRVSDVKASPADPGRVIATSIYDGRINSFAGINVSSDGGATWTKPASATPPSPTFCLVIGSFSEPSAFGIAFDPENPTHVFVGTNCGLAASTDGGLSWTLINPGPGNSAREVRGVVVHHGGIIDTCGGSGHRRSVDGGATWTGAQAGGQPLPDGNCSIAASPDESYVLFATAGTLIFETDSGGGTWNTKFTNPRPQGRVPFVITHRRQGRNFDLWFGDVDLFRAACTTPANPSPGGAPRCPASNTWTLSGKGAHVDMGDVVFTNPPRFNVPACTHACTDARTSCNSDCDGFREQCMSDVGTPGGPLPFQCAQAFQSCQGLCTTRFHSCTVNCNRPQEGCPLVMSSDGGAYVNTLTQSPACQTPLWTQPDVTTRGLWLWSLSGGNIPNSLSREALYMGSQDNGAFATLNAGAASPAWTNPEGGDIFDVVSDSAQVVHTICCFVGSTRENRVFRRNPGMTGGDQIPNYPPGTVPTSHFQDVIARFGPNRYAMVTTSGVFVTQNINANPITWTQLGINPPKNGCGLWVAGLPANPTFFVLSAMFGICPGDFGVTLTRYSGTSSTGQWQTIVIPPGFNVGVGVFAVDPNNANRLFISALGDTSVHMLRSTDGGATWQPDTALDALMTGGGTFRMRTLTSVGSSLLTYPYVQPTLVAFDPNNYNNLLAGAADAGIFLSQNNGGSWTALTNNSGDSGNPVVPRPHWAYFNRECSRYNIYVGTQGRGAWQFSYRDPAGITVSACQARCDAPLQDCKNQCDADLESCMSKVGQPGEPLASQCLQRSLACPGVCSNTRNACRQRCADCPQ
jgi:photosystem II stability/assembly factor-like uncharacterized protein